MNPVLPNHYFIADVEARQHNDGRLYIYGSQDILNYNGYCSNEYRVFSTDNLKDWTSHGVSFSSDQILFAPDCIFKNGLYYLYYCTANGGEYVATSKSPFGPFENSKEIAIANHDSIDPSVFLDDDGQAYYFWGQGNLRGAKLSDDMTSIIEESLNRNVINDKEHGFHEGASIRKHIDTYYLVYTDISKHRATCLSYATSKSPLGPYVKRGIIIDNFGCDYKSWNNHGSIFEFNHNWYVAYHRASFGSFNTRRFCIEPIRFDENGYIPQVEMTTNGTDVPIESTQTIDAYRTSYIQGKVVSKIADNRKEILSKLSQDDWVAYQYFDFSALETAFELSFEEADGNYEIDIKVGVYVNIPACGHLTVRKGDKNARCKVKTRKGVNRLYLSVTKSDVTNAGLNLIDFHFVI